MKLKEIGKVLTSKSVGTGPSSYEKRIYQAAVSQKLSNAGVDYVKSTCNDLTQAAETNLHEILTAPSD